MRSMWWRQAPLPPRAAAARRRATRARAPLASWRSCTTAPAPPPSRVGRRVGAAGQGAGAGRRCARAGASFCSAWGSAWAVAGPVPHHRLPHAPPAALSEGVLWCVGRPVFRAIVVDSMAQRRQQYEAALAGMPIFARLAPEQLAAVADCLQRETFQVHAGGAAAALRLPATACAARDCVVPPGPGSRLPCLLAWTPTPTPLPARRAHRVRGRPAGRRRPLLHH